MKKQNIEAIYPLSPMQQGLLFHSVYEGEGGTYYEQMSCRIEGELNVEAFKKAWQEVVDRHAILRTSFVWEGVKEPVQVVQKGLRLEFREEDWRRETAEEQRRKLDALLREEREGGFDLSKAPLMKMGLMRVSGDGYYFVWGNHHILFDGWCRELIIGEVFRKYEGYRGGREVELERVRPYRDYIGWLGEQDLSGAEKYWREELRGMEGPTELGIERRGGRREEGEYEEKNLRMSEETSRGLEEAAKKWQVTMNTVVEGAWGVVMSRYSGQEEVVFGVTVSGRGGGLRGMEGMVGLFINTLPVRMEIRGEERVQELMRRVQEKQSKVLKYETSPLTQVQGWSEVPRGVPLFKVVFMFQNYPAESGISERAGSSLRISETQRWSRNNYELAIRSIPGKELHLNTIYDGGRFEAANAERLLRHLKRVLEGVVENETARVTELPMMSEEELQQIIIDWNQTAAAYPQDRCAHELYEQQADLRPDAVAVVYQTEHVTYEELNRRANQLARYLRKMGVGAEVKVGLCVDRSPEMIIGLLAVMKAGGAYLPLDAAYPPERLDYMIEDSGCPVIVTTANLLEGLPVSWAQIVMIDEDWPAVATECDGNPELITLPENLAYVIYTSGSTGKPKGVGLTHQSLCNLAVAQNRNLQVEAGASVLQFASFSFDAATWDWLMALTSGAKLVLISGTNAQQPEKVLELIVTHDIEAVTLPPSVLMNVPKRPAPALKTVVVAGEACPNELVSQWSSECRFINAYGPTENTVCATMTGAIAHGERVTIGQANENTHIYILGRNQEPVPVEVTGEIYIAGLGLARGYLSRADETADKFLADPFGDDGLRMYRTGDLGRYNDDGSIEYVGRVDDQVKVRGYRIELGEIEAALNEHPFVTQGVVIVREDESGEKRLVGYVATRRQVSGKELKEYVQKRLPEYMVPRAIVHLAEIPLTANGKVDKNALPRPERATREADERHKGEPNEIETVMAGIWTQVLRVAEVGAQDNFFDLGGHSLLAAQLISRVREVFGIELPLKAIFEATSLADLSRRLEAELRAEVGLRIPPIEKVSREGTLPLSFAQQRMWFINQLQPGGSMYNIPSALRVTGELKRELLERVLSEVVRRHEVLRTRFEVREDQPAQVIDEASPIKVPVIDVSRLDEAQRESDAAKIIKEEAGRGFDLSNGPLFRVVLVRLAEQDHMLLFTMHHIVSDAWSGEVLIREVSALYNAYNRGEVSPLSDLPIQYADYAAWQRALLQGEALREQVDYWRNKLNGVEALALPVDRTRPPQQTYSGSREPIVLNKELMGSIRELIRREGVTVFILLLAVIKVLFHRYTGQMDIPIGSIVSNRNRQETEGLIGFFINTLVLRTDLTGDPTFRELLGRVRQVALEAYVHQEVPFEKLVEELQPERNLSHTPLFQAMFVLQNTPQATIDVEGLQVHSMSIERSTANFDLVISLSETGGHLSGVIDYKTDLFDRDRIERLAGHLDVLLADVVKQPGKRLSQVLLLTESERRQLEEWNGTDREYGRWRSVTALIAEQAKLGGERLAVEFEDQALSYAEVNRRANLLASYLKRHGAGPEKVVGVAMRRSLDLVVSLLAILKAGGAYLPIDIEYPVERIDYMLSDAGVELLLSESEVSREGWTYEGEVLCPNRQWDQAGDCSVECDDERIAEDNLAYVIYTSGSTGRPKAVMSTHRGLYNRLMWMQEAYELKETDCVLQKTPFSFDVSVWEFFWPLMTGAKLEVARPDGHKDSGYLVSAIRDHQVTVLHFVPSMLAVFLDEDDLEKCGSIRQLICSGEALSLDLQQRFFERLDSRLSNLYGPTEASIDVTYWHCHGNDEQMTVPIGYPISNTRIHLLDEHLQSIPIGITGGLHIGGVGLARGYLNRPDLTAERFIPNPFSRARGERIYETGDLARYIRDGSIDFLGRLDHQVKIRGLRIEIGEIEAVLKQHPSVSDGAVVATADAHNDRRIVACLVMRDPAVTVEQLRSFAKNKLPDYMAPAAFVFMQALPLTPNGKVDRRKLAAIESSQNESLSHYVAPRTPIEEDLALIWRELLKKERVGVYDNFFELGGHSLLLTQLASRIRRVFEVEVPLRVLFDAPTIVGVTKAIAGMQIDLLDSNRAEELVNQLKRLSPEEISALLEIQGA